MKPTGFIKKWLKNNQAVFGFIFKVFVFWQLALAAVIALGARYFPTTGAYLYSEKKVVNPVWLWNRANFDGIHYLEIARKGYGLYQQAFFPLYPSLIRLLTFCFGRRDLLAGLSISWIFLVLALFFFYKLVKLEGKDELARRAIFYLLIFPTAFFFSMVYSESLFLFLVLASFYFARLKRWWLAGVLGGLASATRLPGIFLLPALSVEWWQQKEVGQGRLKISKLLPLLLIPLGLLGYMRFLQVHYQDPLMFLHVQPYFGAGRTGGKIVLLYQVFWRYLKMLITVEKGTPTYFVCCLEFFTGTLFLLLTVFVYQKRWFSYFTFIALAYLTPTLTGTFSSLPRYVLILFPGFILLACWAERYRWVKVLYPLIALPLLIVSLLFYSRGYWLA